MFLSIATSSVANLKLSLLQHHYLSDSRKNRVPKSVKIINSRRCECFDLYDQLVPYKKAWSWQKTIVKEKLALIDRNQDCPDSLILLQHSPVYTMGTGSSEDYLYFDIKNAPFDVYRTERGGEVTYHGPGQLIMYPIINLRNHKMDLHWYLRKLEEIVIRVLSSAFSIKASRLDGLTGVWVGDEKVAAIGIRVSKWMTYHGLALNVTTDLAPFNSIVPCGIRNRRVGSIKGLIENGESDKLEDSKLIDLAHESLLKEFSEVFQLQIEKQTVTDRMAMESAFSMSFCSFSVPKAISFERETLSAHRIIMLGAKGTSSDGEVQSFIEPKKRVSSDYKKVYKDEKVETKAKETAHKKFLKKPRCLEWWQSNSKKTFSPHGRRFNKD
ncbi:unnamed protein product, partial [Thlaspi arvense]